MSVKLRLVSGNVNPIEVASGSPVTVQFHHPLIVRLQDSEELEQDEFYQMASL